MLKINFSNWGENSCSSDRVDLWTLGGATNLTLITHLALSSSSPEVVAVHKFLSKSAHLKVDRLKFRYFFSSLTLAKVKIKKYIHVSD